jgi:hypothetical protein
MVERVMIRPPTARIGPITPEERKAIMSKSPVKGKYDTAVDAESAYEMLQKRVAGTAAPADGADASAGGGGILGQIGSMVGTIFGTNVKRGRLSTGRDCARRTVVRHQQGGGRYVTDLGKSVGGSLGSSVGRALARGALGGVAAAIDFSSEGQPVRVKSQTTPLIRNERVLRYPSLRRPFDSFLVCRIAF